MYNDIRSRADKVKVLAVHECRTGRYERCPVQGSDRRCGRFSDGGQTGDFLPVNSTHLERHYGGDRIKHSHTPPTMREKP